MPQKLAHSRKIPHTHMCTCTYTLAHTVKKLVSVLFLRHEPVIKLWQHILDGLYEVEDCADKHSNDK
jgi:hypothetical protein